jgi:hypothetical protein
MEEARDPEIVPSGGGSAGGAAPDAREYIQEPAKLMRIAAMIRELLAEGRQSTLDEPGRKRLQAIHERAVAALRDSLSEDLQQELTTLAIPLEGTPSQSEIRIAQAQLVGWLEGLFHGIQAALFAQQVQARAQLEEMRRRGLPPGIVSADGDEPRRPGQYL